MPTRPQQAPPLLGDCLACSSCAFEIALFPIAQASWIITHRALLPAAGPLPTPLQAALASYFPLPSACMASRALARGALHTGNAALLPTVATRSASSPRLQAVRTLSMTEQGQQSLHAGGQQQALRVVGAAGCRRRSCWRLCRQTCRAPGPLPALARPTRFPLPFYSRAGGGGRRRSGPGGSARAAACWPQPNRAGSAGHRGRRVGLHRRGTWGAIGR